MEMTDLKVRDMSDEDMTDKKKKGMFAPIESREDALKAVKNYSSGFYVLAGMQGALGLFVAPSALIDAVLLAILATFLRFWNSRVAAFLLMTFSTIAVVVTASNSFGTPIFGGGGGKNIVLALLAFWFAIKSIEATNKIHGKYAERQV